VYWRNIDPTTRNRQFCDVGNQYRSAIFYHDAEQRRLAEQSRDALAKTKPFPQPIVTEIVPAGVYTAAEAYHQNYYLKNPVRYKFYRYNCGRDQRLENCGGNPPNDRLRLPGGGPAQSRAVSRMCMPPVPGSRLAR